jgi:oligopeptide/dipeptide ABC transporter ATP-binding protein
MQVLTARTKAAAAKESAMEDGTPAKTPLLDVRDLHVSFNTGHGVVNAVNGVSFQVGPKERIGIVGESGSGKSVMALSMLGLAKGSATSGQVVFDGKDLLTCRESELRALRGSEIGYVFQDPLSALDPVKRVGDQIAEALTIRGVSRRSARAQALDLLKRVGIRDASTRMDHYPHEFSGGMRQRAVIAMTLVGRPRLLIADEPTTALDVRVQAQVLDLLMDIADERDLAVLLITHDLAILAGFAERVVVMYAGRCMEECVTDELFYGSIHPYTLGLLNSLPRVDTAAVDKLAAIGGQPPSPTRLPSGCPFHPRCRYVLDVCRETTPLLETPPNGRHPSACHRSEWLAESPGVQR